MKLRTFCWLTLILFFGLLIRLYLATGNYNNDIINILKAVKFLEEGKNIYQQVGNDNYGYNTSPVFFNIIWFLHLVQKNFIQLPFPFIERAFISLVDVLTLFVLMGIAKLNKLSPIKTAALFFLNPVSIIISGHHGQFDNLAILFLLLGLLVYETKINLAKHLKYLIIWILLTISILVKHILTMQVLIFFIYLTKSRLKGLAFFVLSMAVFLLSFVPYAQNDYAKVIIPIFKYGGIPGVYGFTSVLLSIYNLIFRPEALCLKCYSPILHAQYSTISFVMVIVFAIFYFAFALFVSYKDLGRLLLLSFLFFLTFTSGIGAYFVLTIALASLYPSKWFFVYSLATLFFYLGSVDEFNMTIFRWIPWNIIWIPSIIWFAAEFKLMRPLPFKLKR